jgi:lysozyme
MTPEMMQKLRKSLVSHEEYRKYPYVDTVGKITIGIGYNLSDRGIDDEWINTQYLKDITYFYNQLSSFPWFQSIGTDRQIVLIDMCFMGWKKFLEFEKMIEALSKLDYKQAAFEMIQSKWAEQVKGRAASLAQGMLTGVYEI